MDPIKDRKDSVVYVESGRITEFQKRLDSLNKKAIKFGLDPVKIVNSTEVVFERIFEYVGQNKENQLSSLVPLKKGHVAKNPVILTRIEIEYPMVKLGNWSVVGKLESTEIGNLMFSISKNETDLVELKKRSSHGIECEHCNVKRYRKDGYLLRNNESGEYKEVGGSCLEDFTGIDPGGALFLARMYEMIRIVEGEAEEFVKSGRVNAVCTRKYLADVSFLIAQSGFVSASKSRDSGIPATYHSAIILNNILGNNEQLRLRYIDEIDQHLVKADAIREWIQGLSDVESFNHNVKILLQSDAISIDRKHLAFAAATVPMFYRSLNEDTNLSKQSAHVGTPGEKRTSFLTVDRVIRIETVYGVSELVIMHDSDGNIFKWKTSACPRDIVNEGIGRTLEASFKIKEHDDYNGKAQTAITHMKMLKWVNLDMLESNSDSIDQHTPLEDKVDNVIHQAPRRAVCR